MDHSATYDVDISLWSLEQASALRELARTRSDLPNTLDLGEGVDRPLQTAARIAS